MFSKRICIHFLFFLILSISFSSNFSYAQETSNRGTNFWVAYPAHLDGTATRLTLFLTSQFNATVTITAGGEVLPKVVVAANKATTVVIDPTVYKNVYVESSEVIEPNKGIQVSSDKPIIVYSHISHSFRSAATLVFPTKVLGTDYYTVNYKQSSKSNEVGYSQFTIVGVEDATEIEIIPTQKSKSGSHQANVPFTIKLNKGDVYQYQSSTDLSGSRVHTLNSCLPFALFSGSSFTYFCELGVNNPTADSGDNLYQQLLPITAWGKNFVTAPFYNALHGSTDVFRIIVATDNTTITVNGSTSVANGARLANPYAKGSIVTFNSNAGNTISADKPISVAQLQTSQGCNINNYTVPGDPEMTILNPVEQTLKDFTVYSAVTTDAAITSITLHFINIVIKTADAPSFKIDGAACVPDSFKVINPEFSYIILDVSKSSDRDPTHRLTAAEGFSAIAYGYGIPESYGYLAGTDLRNLTAYTPTLEARDCTTNKIAKTGLSGSAYKFVLTLPYITASLIWDFGNGNVYTAPLPAYTKETIKDMTIYTYEYTGRYPVAGNYKMIVHAINPLPLNCNPDEVIEFKFSIGSPPYIPPKPQYPPDFFTEVQVWDFDCMDFDTISVKLNGKQIGPPAIPIQLYEKYGNPEFTFPLELQKGDNILEFYAISEGVKRYTSIGILLIGQRTRSTQFFKLEARQTMVLHVFKE